MFYLNNLIIFSGSDTVFLRNGPLKSKHIYALEQFHAHWGSNEYKGSEHIVDGKSYIKEKIDHTFYPTTLNRLKDSFYIVTIKRG